MAEGKAPASAAPASGPSPDPQTANPSARRGGTRALGACLPGLVRTALRRQGFAATEVVTRWSAIVGERIAQRSVPEKVTFPTGRAVGGTLHVRVDGPLALELQHLAPQLVERVNAFYGHAAIAHVALKQGRLPPPRRRPPPAPPLGPTARAALDEAVEGTGDPDLKHALERLGRHILATDRR